jgi:PAS domain S-box-containing protein
VSFARLLCNTTNLEQILDSLKEGVIAHDLQRRIFFFNREAERITGLRREDVVGRDCHEAMSGPFCGQQCSFCGNAPLLSESEERTLDISHRDGERRRVELTVTMMKDAHGNGMGVLAAFRDITGWVDCRLPPPTDNPHPHIIGRDPKMHRIFKQIEEIADYDFPVHISGETGTGKELIAAAIHRARHPDDRAPFVPINCGALPEGLIESELFGHVKGAFTGAVRDRKGRFELAQGGTVFLDEIAELSKYMQVKLLRLLQEGTFERVGEGRPIAVKVRVISATNKDLRREVQENRFRDDLFYRVNVIRIHLPPLRERSTDIPLLVDHFLRQVAERSQRKPLRMARETMALLMAYGWPGNIRELQNAVQSAMVKCSGRTIYPRDLPLEMRATTRQLASVEPSRSLAKGPGPYFKLTPEAVQESLDAVGGNKQAAARALGVGRATLYRFLQRHPQLVSAE